MNENKILEEASKFSERCIELMQDVSPGELPLGNEENLKSHDGKISRVGLDWAAMGLRYFPRIFFEDLEDRLGKEEAAKMEYDFGRKSGIDIHQRYLALGMGELESVLAVMSSSAYSGWGIPYIPKIDQFIATMSSTLESIAKEKRDEMSMEEIADVFKSKVEKVGGEFEILSESTAKMRMKVYWVNSFVAESFLHKKSRYQEQKCHFLCGIMYGVVNLMASVLAKEPEEKYNTKLPFELSANYVREISCKAQGETFCTMEWGIKIVRR